MGKEALSVNADTFAFFTRNPRGGQAKPIDKKDAEDFCNFAKENNFAQLVAMLAGRVLSGIAKALIFMPGISLTAWITASFITALPGILIQLVFLPSVVLTLMKAKVIPVRYTKEHPAV